MTTEQIGNAVTFLAHYVASKVSKTGLTVTIDVWEIQKDGTAAEIVTAGSATEIGDGLYRYILASGSVDAEGEYVGVFKTTDTSVDQQHLPALWSIQRGGVESLDAAVSTRSTLTAQQVWEYATRTLTGFGSLVADIWSYVTRTLTANVSGVTIISAVSGNAISVYEYATWNFTITDSALALTDYENLIFVVKDDSGDTDDEAVLLVDITTGLKRIGRATPSNANLGSVVKDSETSFTVLVAMSEVAAKIGSNYAGVRTWQLKGIDTTDDPDQGFVLIEGNFVIKDGKARAII